MRVAITGAHGAGKSTLARAVSARTGLPVVHGSPMRDPAGMPPAGLDEVDSVGLLQLTVRRYVERSLEEARCTTGFLSDGSTLHEWVYATVRLAVGTHPGPEREEPLPPSADPVSDVVAGLGREIIHRAVGSYDLWLHLPVEFPLRDGKPPISRTFRVLSDRLLLSTLEETGVRVHVLTGTPGQRETALLDLMEDVRAARGRRSS
ncbi:AAA family ATPase [Streptomyces alkaliphilus]|uniref:AAA family ATPase n=1 Tax=Streptomyces alkaliphilus TaxID=1472722 RepID=A0A7W3TDF0_9ACTN|nr:AAA family ATPase [Streptomyces alkaliphilus]MBB0244801.1 AAA family ATPase [Streptomyces alkaliphilus]